MKRPLKTKTVHGLRTGHHDNPNVLRAARAKRADGGSVLSEDSKREAARLREEIPSGFRPTTIATGVGLGASLARSLPPKVRALGALVTGAGGAKVFGDAKNRHRNNVEADRIEKGLVKPGEEDRKRGGRVKKKGC